MAAIFARKCFLRFFSATAPHVKINLFSISAVLTGGQRWRVSNGLAGDGLAYGPLTDSPDWSFVDGQSAPESRRRKKRQNRRTSESKRIIQYLKEVNGKEPSDPQGDKM